MDLYKEIENCFPLVEKQFTHESLLEFKNTPISDLYLYHFGLGAWIRNNLLYPKENHLYDLFILNGIKHPDEMPSLIITKFYFYITEKT